MRILLDAHIPLAVATQLQRHGVDAVALHDWMDGAYLNAQDDLILMSVYRDGRVFVTYDRRTIPPLLLEWAELGQHHSGVVIVDEKTIQPNDVGGLLRAILKLLETSETETWEDHVVYLRPG